MSGEPELVKRIDWDKLNRNGSNELDRQKHAFQSSRDVERALKPRPSTKRCVNSD